MNPVRLVAEVLMDLLSVALIIIALVTMAPAAREALERWVAAQGPNVSAGGDDDSRESNK